MNNTEKLLRAFIEASGFDIESVERKCGTDERIYETHTESTDLYTTDYKVTLKPLLSTYTHSLGDLSIDMEDLLKGRCK